MALFIQMNRATVESAVLVNEYYPDFSFPRKVELVSKAAEAHGDESSTITISRFMYADSDTLAASGKTDVVLENGFYSYESDADSEESKVWYVNFADPQLFVAYDSGLFAQDEIQTLEMPLLAAVREYLDKQEIPGLKSLTKEGSEPTPILIESVPYWNKVVTNPILDNGTQVSIYGNSFEIADDEAIKKGITVFNGWLCNNIMAIAAPYGSFEQYRKSEIEYILKTLLCSFSAAVNSTGRKTVIHTGNWGCGAFGGNKELMYAAQLICADICGVDSLVMHGADENVFCSSKKVYDSAPREATLEELVDFLDRKKYSWGIGNGT